MIKIALAAAITLYSLTTQADTEQIEVIGLVPGESTKAQVIAVHSGSTFVIGGYKLMCHVDYISEILAKLSCITGKEWKTTDTTTGSTSTVSNIEVHAALLRGFTKKFGNPSNVIESKHRNLLGTSFQRHSAVWVDRMGNRLSISSMLSIGGEITDMYAGVLILESAQQIKAEETNKDRIEQQRKF